MPQPPSSQSSPAAPGGIERALFRLLGRILPTRFADIADLIGEAPPPTPTGTVAVEIDDAARRLRQIDHVVVLMLENRSFDHMLGYLSLQGGRADVDGLKAGMKNEFEGERPIHHLDRTAFATEAEDPSHSGDDVHAQIAGGEMSGFAANFAKHGSEFAAGHPDVPVPDPGLVMGYYDAADLPVYDFLAANFTICDRWFSSVPGATWPNRLYSIAGRAEGSKDDRKLPIYTLPGFPRFLDRAGVDWRWYSYDPGTLRLVDPEYRFSQHHRFSYVDKRKVKLREEIVGELLEEGPSFLDDAASGNLPAVSWIDPHFKDAEMLGPDSNDDHAPGDVTAGQDLVLTIYHALRQSKAWEKTLFLVTYDEHGGFFDHVAPPAAPDDDPAFRQFGIRVPALIASPWVEAARCDHTQFDHTSIIKTILLRFCEENGRIPDMGLRTSQANHLGALMSDSPRADVPDHGALATGMEAWRASWTAARFADPRRKALRVGTLTELQDGLVEAERHLRKAGLPAGHP
jgi:phospholipase C